MSDKIEYPIKIKINLVAIFKFLFKVFIWTVIIFGAISMFIPSLLAKFYLKSFKKDGKNKGPYIAMIILFSLILIVCISVAVIPYNSSLISLSWYDWILPIATGLKVFANMSITTSAGTFAFELLALMSTLIIFSFTLTLIFGLSRKKAELAQLARVQAFNDNFNEGVDIGVPFKDMGYIYRYINWILSIDMETIEDTFFEPEQPYEEKVKTHVMLNQKYGIPIKQLNKHLAIIGTTGSGKTETTFKFIEDSIKREKPTIFVDGKGDKNNILRMKDIADTYKKPFYLFTISGQKLGNQDFPVIPKTYNPFVSKKTPIIVDSIMALFDFSEEHYKAGARVYMDILIKSMIETEKDISWENILYYMDKQKLNELLKQRYKITPIKKQSKDNKVIKLSVASSIDNTQESALFKNYSIDKTQLENIDPRAISGFAGRIGMFYNTTRDTIKPSGFTLEDVFNNNGVAVFSLNSLDYQVQAGLVGKLIMNDIKASAEKNALLGKQTTIALDEFNIFASNNVIDILNKTRSKGYEMILSFQSIADLSKVSIDFRNQIIENTNSKIIHKTNDPEGAEYLANVLGKRKEFSETYHESDSDSNVSSRFKHSNVRVSHKIVDQFIASPDKIKNLQTGEVFAKYHDHENIPIVTPKIQIQIHNN